MKKRTPMTLSYSRCAPDVRVCGVYERVCLISAALSAGLGRVKHPSSGFNVAYAQLLQARLASTRGQSISMRKVAYNAVIYDIPETPEPQAIQATSTSSRRTRIFWAGWKLSISQNRQRCQEPATFADWRDPKIDSLLTYFRDFILEVLLYFLCPLCLRVSAAVATENLNRTDNPELSGGCCSVSSIKLWFLCL